MIFELTPTMEIQHICLQMRRINDQKVKNKRKKTNLPNQILCGIGVWNVCMHNFFWVFKHFYAE